MASIIDHQQQPDPVIVEAAAEEEIPVTESFDTHSGGRIFSLGLVPNDIFKPQFDCFSIAQLEALEQFFHNALHRIDFAKALLQTRAEIEQLQEMEELYREVLSSP